MDNDEFIQVLKQPAEAMISYALGILIMDEGGIGLCQNCGTSYIVEDGEIFRNAGNL